MAANTRFTLPTSANTAVNYTDKGVTTIDVAAEFCDLISSLDDKVEGYLDDHKTATGELQLTSAQSLALQKMMGDQSIASTAGSSLLKSLKDSISGAARNIG